MVDHVITPVMVHIIVTEVDTLLRSEFPEAFADPEKGRGGAFFVWKPRNSSINRLETMVAVCPEERLPGRIFNAREKADRLSGNLEVGHVLSFQSRDEANGKWPGAVAGLMNIYSLSGYDADMDELEMLMTAYRAGDMSLDDVKAAIGARGMMPNKHIAAADYEKMKRLFPGW